MPDDNKIQTPDYDPENPRCDQEQLKFLKDCIAKGSEGITKWNQWREENIDAEIWLQSHNGPRPPRRPFERKGTRLQTKRTQADRAPGTKTVPTS